MEQTPSLPGRSPELPSVSPPSNGEVGAFSHPEVALDSGVEQQRTQEGPVAQTAAPPVVAPVPMPQVQTDDAVVSVATAMSPAVANDDDLIEKEWVVKTKKVLEETRDDPYRREQEVGRLQADYLEKRYGRKLGSSE